MALQDLPLSKKIFVALAGVLATVLVVCATLYSFHQATVRAAHLRANTLAAADEADRAMAKVHDQNAALHLLSPSEKRRVEAAYQHAGEDIEAALHAARQSAAQTSAVSATLDHLSAAVRSWQRDIGGPVATVASDPAKTDGARTLLASEHADTLFEAVRQAAQVARQSINTWAEEAETAERQSETKLQSALLCGALLSVGAAVAALLWLTRSIATPMAATTAAMQRLAAGDRTAAIPAWASKDEIGEMITAVGVFKAVADEIKLCGDSRLRPDESGSYIAWETTDDGRLHAHVVDSVAIGLEHLLDGDLGFQLEAPCSPAFEKLRYDFNDALKMLRKTIKIVSSTSRTIRSDAAVISTITQNLSDRTGQQATHLDEAAAALDQIASTIVKTAENLDGALELVARAKAAADASREIARQAIAAMTEIERASQQVSRITRVIDDIAFQTNLLALNAGVEAARAGGSGRGFAVIASEVRALAKRSAEAAQEIDVLIFASNVQVDRGVYLVGETSIALERIVSQVAGIDEVIADIAASAEAQATGIKEIHLAINEMDEATQQNAAMVARTEAASRTVTHRTGELAHVIDRSAIWDERDAEI